MCAHAFGKGHSTLTGFDPLELICAEPDPVSGGTRLAKYPSLCQPFFCRGAVYLERVLAELLLLLSISAGGTDCA